MLVDAGILGYSGHLSTLTGDGQTLLIQPVNDARAELRPDRLLVVTLDGDVVEGDGKPPSELAIHTEIYRARPDVGAVAHFHHDPTTVFTVAGEHRVVPVKNHASRWSAGVPVHPDSSHIATAQQGRELAATLGGCQAALLRAHGQVVVAEDVRTLFADVVHFVENATLLAAALPGTGEAAVGSGMRALQRHLRPRPPRREALDVPHHGGRGRRPLARWLVGRAFRGHMTVRRWT
jgi:ribulose-5-phosphate 4-epimerase/fuculose-1-phosphate aldolase